jgi:hypothetical protein
MLPDSCAALREPVPPASGDNFSGSRKSAAHECETRCCLRTGANAIGLNFYENAALRRLWRRKS